MCDAGTDEEQVSLVAEAVQVFLGEDGCEWFTETENRKRLAM